MAVDLLHLHHQDVEVDKVVFPWELQLFVLVVFVKDLVNLKHHLLLLKHQVPLEPIQEEREEGRE